MKVLEEIRTALIQGDHQKVAAGTQRAVDGAIEPVLILNSALIEGMDIIGRRFRKREIFLPQVLLAARAMSAGMDVLTPCFTEGSVPSKGRIVLGTVKGDLHDIGKNLVGVMLKGAGYEIVDLGKDVPAEVFVDTALEVEARVIGLSALLTTTMPAMGEVIDLLRSRPGQGISVIVGGAPVTREFARDIGADGFAFDALSAVDTVVQILGGAT